MWRLTFLRFVRGFGVPAYAALFSVSFVSFVPWCLFFPSGWWMGDRDVLIEKPPRHEGHKDRQVEGIIVIPDLRRDPVWWKSKTGPRLRSRSGRMLRETKECSIRLAGTACSKQTFPGVPALADINHIQCRKILQFGFPVFLQVLQPVVCKRFYFVARKLLQNSEPAG